MFVCIVNRFLGKVLKESFRQQAANKMANIYFPTGLIDSADNDSPQFRNRKPCFLRVSASDKSPFANIVFFQLLLSSVLVKTTFGRSTNFLAAAYNAKTQSPNLEP
jgi:hypothetical protein